MEIDSKNKFLNTFFQNFDFFSVKYGFRINEKNDYKSNFGGVVFIIYFVFIIAYFSLTFRYFWNGKEFSINYLVLTSNETEINLYDRKFSFGFKYDKFAQKYFRKEVKYFDGNSSIKIKTKNCTLINGEIKFENFSTNFECIDFNNIFISENLENETNKYLTIKIFPTIELVKGLLNPIVLDKISKYYFQLYWFDKNIIAEKFGNPVENIFMTKRMYLDITQAKVIDFYVSNMEISSDDNIYYHDKLKQNLSKVDKISQRSYGISILKFITNPNDYSKIY